MTELTLPTGTVTVLDAPLTAEQYRQASDHGDRGEVTRTVSLDTQFLIGADPDIVLEAIAENVVSELGEDWEVYSYRLVGRDPRYDGTPAEGCFGLFEVTVQPDAHPA